MAAPQPQTGNSFAGRSAIQPAVPNSATASGEKEIKKAEPIRPAPPPSPPRPRTTELKDLKPAGIPDAPPDDEDDSDDQSPSGDLREKLTVPGSRSKSKLKLALVVGILAAAGGGYAAWIKF